MDDSHPLLGAQGPINGKICIVGPNGPFYINVINPINVKIPPEKLAMPSPVISVNKKQKPGGSKKRYRLWKKNPHCKYCKIKLLFEHSSLDHVVPRSKGGSNNIENLVLACHKCNNKKGCLSLEEYQARQDKIKKRQKLKRELIEFRRQQKIVEKRRKRIVSRCELVLL